MKAFIQSITRTPGLLLMLVLAIGFTINAGVNYLNETGSEGPNLLAAVSMLVGIVVVAVVQQLRRAGQGKESDKS